MPILRMYQTSPLLAALAISLSLSGAALATPDLYIKDTPADTGVEPNPDPGPMWVSEDVWIRTVADPNYLPYPFPEASPTWIPQPHENPEYRDPKYGKPNYVYVRVHNRGTTASTGTERLKAYWAKASTGLSWPTQFGGAGVDYLASNCGPTKLYGSEITKPRKNAATATPAERDAYRQAIISLATSFAWGSVSYWHKQQEVHVFGPSNRHHTRAFLPWHRDFINRYEAMLQEADPTVKLLYWDWTTDPVGLFTPSFLGNSGRGTGGVSFGPPFDPPLTPPSVTRHLGDPPPPADDDATVLSNTAYPDFSPAIELCPNHDCTHDFAGGSTADMAFPSTAAKDPFFFLLHANVDRLWAKWQRAPNSLSRLDRNAAYGLSQTNINITTDMRPWDGSGSGTGLIDPWTATSVPSYIVVKKPTDASVVSPPFYDDAPLTIPVLQPGEAVIIEIPWYPPNPADFGCFGGDQGHFCLVARIETAITAPFGMTVPEGPDIGANTRNNNNIAWKNVTVVDNFPGALRLTSILIRNTWRERVLAGLRFGASEDFAGSFFDFGRVLVDLKPELFKRWREGGGGGQGIERVGGTTVQITSPRGFLQNIRLEPEEVFSIDVSFELNKDYRPLRGVRPKVTLIQTGAPGKPDAIVGGQRFDLDFSKLVLVKRGAEWRYLDDGSKPGSDWMTHDFDDQKWKLGRAELGFGNNPDTTINAGPPGRRHPTAYFRHVFDVADPSIIRTLHLRLKRNDGAVVYLNGKEIHRVNLPSGAVTPRTPATRDVRGLERNVFFPVQIPNELIERGRNVIAAEVHLESPASPDLSFDLELYANPAETRVAPEIAFAAPMAGALFQRGEAIPVDVEALAVTVRIASVALFADNKLIGRVERPPFSFKWESPDLGQHRLRVVATNNDRLEASADTIITVVENVPPNVRLTQPADGAVFSHGDGIAAFARASDRGGKVSSVEFLLRDADKFVARDEVVGTVQDPPYTVQLKDLAPGHYALIAVARDDRGLTSESNPVHFEVGHQ